MPNLTERKRIEISIMVEYGDKLPIHQEACYLLNQEHPHRAPIVRSRVSKIVSKFEETGNVRDLPRPNIDQETKLNILLEAEENPHASTR
ncbi:hypothetical protein ILUMI_19755 [Ignelater luminosus]|uniref:DUF4817 domain-containing protein n=1 Tax=Ignelater luminosus TaxID=2038154 RepID=A0A8K0CLT8_IGNLU|nr:hypothetical protein ILUMI_19755 [Ignelater luminosus]